MLKLLQLNRLKHANSGFMPRGQIDHLSNHRFQAIWKHQPTTCPRIPKCMAEGLRKIAQWADEKSDPEQAIAQLLELAYSSDQATPRQEPHPTRVEGGA